jgi:signal transduction histidine kinase
MVVHDLKNPVNGIAMMVRLALRKGDELPEKQRGYLQQIDRTCREMMRLIQNLLEISKIEEGKMPVAAEPVVLAELVDEVVAEYGPVAEQTARRLLVAVSTDLPAARGDRAIMKRVLVNLVVNALRHSGSADVHIEGLLGPGADEITLGVRDRGRGIAEADRARVFEKFRILRRSPTDDPAVDTGLGLPFCKLAVEQMGGRIELTSAPGDSTVFAVTLPVHRPFA